MTKPLFAGLAAGMTGLLGLSSLMWLHAGKQVYVDRLLSALAGCF